MNVRTMVVVVSQEGVLLSKTNGLLCMPSFLGEDKHPNSYTPEQIVMMKTGITVRSLCTLGEKLPRLDGDDLGHLCLVTGGVFRTGPYQNHAYYLAKDLKCRKGANSIFENKSTERLAWDALSILASPSIATEVDLKQVEKLCVGHTDTVIVAKDGNDKELAQWPRLDPFKEGFLD